MTITRSLMISAVVMAGAATLSVVHAQQTYPVPQGTYSQAPQSYPPAYPSDDRRPNFDQLQDDQANAAAQPPRAPTGPILSPDDPRYANAVPQGPVMSPNDPRYGRPAGPPPVIYGDRPPGAPQGYPNQGYANQAYPNQGYANQAYGDPNAPRPPEAVGPGGPAPAVTGSVEQQPTAAPDGRPVTIAALPPEEQPDAAPAQLAPNLRRQEVNFATKEPAGTIVVDTSNTYLYYVLGNGRAIRYGVRVGRDGFTWSGVQKITRKKEWPDWYPPSEMIDRQPYLPRFMAGGPGNPLGARAMYLGNTVYRIHGTNQPSTIGKFVSSGCIGMLNEDVSDLFDRVKVGTRVVVLPGGPPPGTATATASAAPVPGPSAAQPAQASAAPGYGQPTVVPPLPAPVTVR
ncbi:MAG TPA: L,D-transpeptidase family protein [Bradyrhizobium sp.]|uniref:L,D-transpeptidase n=1 Tax=Bradyrhizobium sp. TaxID=376 RepID=UPI002C013060|nr:L,D-transpeptidase family protein [Bradyrhizobium sp.]HLZ01874.1 L,D-transpeptidase family protein [Bradyrhizobium sp.]